MEKAGIGAISGIIEKTGSTDMDGKYLTFITDKQLFGVPIADVVQIVGMQKITEIPEFPSYAKGIINMRGTVIPLIDVRMRFGKEERAYDEHTCIIITLIHNLSVGFIVDAVDAVTDIGEKNISPPPKLSSGSTSSFLIGVAKTNGKVVLLLSTEKLLSEEVLSDITSMGDAKNV